jgi:hypothetical protein
MQNTAAARPTGVTVIAVLAIIVGVLGAIVGLLALLAGGLLTAAGAASGTAEGAAAGGLVLILSIILLAIAIAEIVFGIGAWGLKPWAWTLGVVLFGANIILSVIQAIISNNWTGQILGILISAVVLYYLFTPPVKAAFGRS